MKKTQVKSAVVKGLSHVFLIVLNVFKLMLFYQIFANSICGVPQGSVLGRLKCCLYLLPISAILKYHKIGYHDDTQLYISFKCKQPLESIFESKQLSF